MEQLSWRRGNAIGIDFDNDNEYYQTLGYLANREKHHIDVYTHNNGESGAWSGQGKLERNIPRSLLHTLPRPLQVSFSKSGDTRLSVTDYVENLIDNHAFSNWFDPTGNMYTFYRFPNSYDAVASTVPAAYLIDFRNGYNML